MARPPVIVSSSVERWTYLTRPSEQLRYAVIASLLKSLAPPGRVVELGSGHGHLLAWLDPAQVSAYEAVDIDAGLLSGLRHDRIEVTRKAQAVERYQPPAGPLAALVASEVLYYVEDPGRHLDRLWRATGAIDLVLISSVLPRPDKPNWRTGYERVRRAVAGTGWPVLDRVRIDSESDRLAWEIVALTPGAT
ncbi:MAG: methyltransferase domain-containing protein [Hyphomicrobiaceae bacterium]